MSKTLSIGQIQRRLLKIASAASELRRDLEAQVDGGNAPAFVVRTYNEADQTAAQYTARAESLFGEIGL